MNSKQFRVAKILQGVRKPRNKITIQSKSFKYFSLDEYGQYKETQQNQVFPEEWERRIIIGEFIEFAIQNRLRYEDFIWTSNPAYTKIEVSMSACMNAKRSVLRRLPNEIDSYLEQQSNGYQDALDRLQLEVNQILKFKEEYKKQLDEMKKIISPYKASIRNEESIELQKQMVPKDFLSRYYELQQKVMEYDELYKSNIEQIAKYKKQIELISNRISLVKKMK